MSWSGEDDRYIPYLGEGIKRKEHELKCGTVIGVKKMSDAHLVNAVKLFRNHPRNLGDYEERFEKELRKRGISNA